MAETVTFVELVDWLEDRLAPAEARQIAAAVAADSALREVVAWLQEFRCLAGDIVLAAPPPSLRPALEALFEAHHAGGREADVWRCYDARLAGDSLDGAERRLFYASPVGHVTLVMRQRRRDAHFDLYGAILPLGDELASFAVELQQGGRTVRLLASDRWGEFTFRGLAAGRYQLVVSGEGAELAISDLQLGAV
jgi:hypothetical protein